MKSTILKKNKIFILKDIIAAAFLIISVSVCMASTAFSDDELFGVNFTTDSDPGSFNIGIAGNPDCYPYEYYDAVEQCYKGVFPEIYARIHSETGLNFVYTRTGSEDLRLFQAKSGYDGIISCYVADNKEMELYGLSDAIPVAIRLNEEKQETLSMCFTSAITDSAKEMIKTSLSGITDSDILEIMSHYALYQEEETTVRWYIYLITGVIAAFIIALITALIIKNINEKKAKETKNRRIDSKTGFLTREAFAEEFNRIEHESYKADYYLIFISFQASMLNLRAGYEATELIIEKAVSVLRNFINNDICARYSGSTFTILHPCLSDDDVSMWIEKLLSLMNKEIKKEGLDNITRFCAGLYRLEPENWNLQTAIEFSAGYYQKADSELTDYYMPETSATDSDHFKAILSDQIPAAFTENEFILYLQPLVDAKTGRIYSAEALSRWKHPELGIISPFRYIDILSEKGWIIRHDLNNVEIAAKLLDKWTKEGIEKPISVNFTRITLSERDVAEKILTKIEPFKFDRKKLVIEITEDTDFANIKQAQETARKLTDAGLLLSLDDVGAGYSLFSDLADYPYSAIKMDKKLLYDCSTPKGRALFTGIVSTCRKMNMTIICEGIETKEQYDFVRENGADLIQGFYFYQPLPIDEFEKLIKEQ